MIFSSPNVSYSGMVVMPYSRHAQSVRPHPSLFLEKMPNNLIFSPEGVLNSFLWMMPLPMQWAR